MNAFNDWGELFAMLHTSPKTGDEKKEVVEETPQAAPIPVADTPVVEEPKPAPEPEPILRDEWEHLSEQERMCEQTIQTLCEKIHYLVSLCDPFQQPKGIRTVIRHLHGVSDTALATKALVDFYLENNAQQLHSIEESKLNRKAINVFRSLQDRKPKLLAGMDELESMIKAGEERVILNLRTRNLKDQTFKLFSEAERQAEAFSKAIEMFPSEDGSLALLKRFAERNDPKEMACIDNTLNLAGTAMVLVADAPAMLEALKNNDTNAIVSLQKKLIDNIFDKK